MNASIGHMHDVIEIEQFGRLVTNRLGVQPEPALLQEFLREVASSGSAAAYLEQLSTPESMAEWFGEPATRLLTHETYFFRNQGHWEALRQLVVPELLGRLEAQGSHLRIWSAGCASGEEPLSIAMALLDMGLSHLLPPGAIVGTDVSEASLAKAREGQYTGRALQCMPANVIERHFEPHQGQCSGCSAISNIEPGGSRCRRWFHRQRKPLRHRVLSERDDLLQGRSVPTAARPVRRSPAR